LPTSSAVELWQVIADEASRESPLWGEALRPLGERECEPVFSPLGEGRFALGLETIYEGYLLHYGRSRLFAPADRDTALLLGDYLYAHGLVRIAELHDVDVIMDLAALISLCAQLRAEERQGDGEAWAATAALLGEAPLATGRDAREVAEPAAVERALAAHRARVR
jgi:hypothetical protein